VSVLLAFTLPLLGFLGMNVMLAGAGAPARAALRQRVEEHGVLHTARRARVTIAAPGHSGRWVRLCDVAVTRSSLFFWPLGAASHAVIQVLRAPSDARYRAWFVTHVELAGPSRRRGDFVVVPFFGFGGERHLRIDTDDPGGLLDALRTWEDALPRAEGGYR
jgi:hypothetical protein